MKILAVLYTLVTRDCCVCCRNLVQPSTRRGIAFAGNDEFGLTDIEMANDIEYSDGFYEDKNNFEMEYEVRISGVSSF